MSSHRAPRRAGTGWRRAPLAVLAVVAALGSVTSLATYASWNDTASVAGTTITSGSLDLKVDDLDTLPSWSPLSMTNLAPGESTAASLTVRNAGTTPFTLTATGSASGADLLPVVNLTVVVGGTATTDDLYPRTETCNGGTQVYSGTLAGAPTVLPASANLAPTTGGGTAQVCLVATLPSTAGNQNGLQNKSWVPTFTFTATQR